MVLSNLLHPKSELYFELIFCMLFLMQQFLVRPVSLSVSSTFKCHSTGVILVGSSAISRRVFWNSVCPSVLMPVFPSAWLFLWNWIFLKEFWHKARNPCAWQSWMFLKKFFCPQNWGNGPKICSIMNVNIIFVFLSKSHIWEKFLFGR